MRQTGFKSAPSQDEAEALALQGLTFLAADGERLVRFLSITGLTPGDLKSWAEAQHMQSAVLDHLLADESLLLVFSAEANIAPERVGLARHVLAGDLPASKVRPRRGP